MAKKVIITCAITGGVHTPTMSPYLPVTPDEIAAQSIEAAEAGASIIHLHARNPETGEPSCDPAIYQRFVQRIKGSSDAVINITTGGGMNMTIEERTAAARAMKPEMCSLNMGSLNFGYYDLAKRYENWKFPWEKPMLESSIRWIFKNTFEDIAWIIENVGNAFGTKFEFECYDVGHLYTLASFVDRGLIKGPLFIQTIFGVHGGIGAHPEDVLHQRRTADRLFGKDYHWSVLATGKNQMKIAAMAALMGGNVRVGLEDNLYIGPGELAKSNAEQVRMIRQVVESSGLQVASPDEARAMLGLKGGANVQF